jgi:hypothetical protein
MICDRGDCPNLPLRMRIEHDIACGPNDVFEISSNNSPDIEDDDETVIEPQRLILTVGGVATLGERGVSATCFARFGVVNYLDLQRLTGTSSHLAAAEPFRATS